MRECLKSYSATQEVKNYTFNTLRRLMPTGADVLQFNDTIAAAIGNWQEIPGGRNDKKGRVKNQMAKLIRRREDLHGGPVQAHGGGSHQPVGERRGRSQLG